MNTARRPEEPPPALRSWLQEQLPDLSSIEPMAGGAGARRYWRLRCASGATAVCMEARPEDPAILPPALRRSTGIPFLDMTDWLAAHGFPVPKLYAVAAAERWIVLEDLGSQHLLDLGPQARAPHYRKAVELLGALHSLPTRADAAETAQPSLPYSRQFDREWVLFELRLFLDLVPDPALRAALEGAFEQLADCVAALPRSVCLRDYQSHNLMIDAAGALRIIDYQDALLAPPELDLAALLHDSYVDLERAERAALLRHYESARGRAVEPGALAALIVQRKCKDLSRFRRLIERGDLRYRGPDGRAARAVSEALPALPASLAGAAQTLADALGRLPS